MAWRTQARYALERTGFSRDSVITGRIVHNQRTEWLWAELNTYSSLFTCMENEGIQDSTDELHIFCLCDIYLQRVQKAAAKFRHQ